MADNNIPKNITQIPGLKDWEKYNGVDIEGQHYSPSQISARDDLAAAMRAKTLYKQGDRYTTNFSESSFDSSISLNPDTGNAVVTAPKQFFETEYYKETLKPQLLEMSRAYKINPDYAYKLLSDSENKKTTADWVAELDKDFAKQVRSALQLAEEADALSRSSGLKMGNKQAVKASTVAIEYNTDTGETVQVKDTDMQSLPLSIRRMKAFQNLEGYDEENHVVSFGDIKKVLDREKTSDADLIEMRDAVYHYFEEGNFTDADEYAEMVAFKEFIDRYSPTEGFWRIQSDILGNFGTGIGMGIANLGLGTNEVIGGILDFIGLRSEGDADYYGTATARDRAALEEAQRTHQERAQFLNPATAWIENVGYAGVPIAAQIYLGAITGNFAGALAGNLAAGAAAKTAMGAAETIQNITTAQVLATDLYRGTETMLSIQSAAKANATIAGAITSVMTASMAGVAGAYAGLKNLSTSARAFISMSDLAANTVVDVVMTNPRLFRQFLESEGNNDAKAYIMEQVNQNVIFWGGLNVAKGAFKVAGKTKLGTVVNVVATSKASYLKARINEASEAISKVLHGGDAEWLKKKVDKAVAAADAAPSSVRKHNRMVRLQRKEAVQTIRNEILRGADDAIGSLHLFKGQPVPNSFEELYERAMNMRKTQSSIFAKANSVADTLYAMSRAQEHARLAAKYINFRDARDSYLDALRTLIATENKVGLTDAQKLMKAGSDLVPAISKTTNGYINSTFRLQLLRNWEGAIASGELQVTAEVLSALSKEIAHHTEVIKAFQREYGNTELISAANELLRKAKALSRQTEAMRVGEGILSQATVDAWDADPRWKNGYLRQQRESEFVSKMKNTGEIRVNGGRGTQHLKLGSTEEYADISFVLFDDIDDVAKQTIRNRLVSDLEDLGIPVTYRVEGNEIRQAQVLNANQNRAIKHLQQTADDFVSTIDDDFINKFFDRQIARSNIYTMSKKGQDLALKSVKAKSTIPRVTVAERLAFVNNLGNDELDVILKAQGDTPFTIQLTDDDALGEFLEGLGAPTRRKIVDQINAHRGIAYAPLDESDTPLNVLSSAPEIATPSERWSRYRRQTVRGATSERANWAKTPVLPGSDLIGKNGAIRDAYDISLDDFREYLATTPNAWTNLKRDYLVSHPQTLKISQVDAPIAAMKRAGAVDVITGQYSTLVEKLNNLIKQYKLDDFDNNLNDLIDGYINDAITSNKYDKNIMATLGELGDGEDITEYMTLRAMANKENLDKIAGKFRGVAAKQLNELLVARKIANPDDIYKISEKWADIATEWLEDRIVNRYGEVANTLRESGSKIVDQQDLYERVRGLNQRITEAKQDPRVVKVFSGNGIEEYVELSPTIAHLITSRPNFYWATPFGEISQRITKVFRMGTTGGLVPNSLVNQAFKDTGLAVTTGDALKLPSTIQDELASEFGEVFAKEYAENAPDVYESLMRKAKTEGREFGEVASEYERGIGRANVETQLESQLYSSAKQNYYQRNVDGVYDKSVFDGIKAGFDKVYEKTEKLNNMRETAERDFVYMNNFQKALQSGMGVQESRRFAQAIQANATTNFGRWTYHLDALSNSVPYLSAAINGQKSFWRLMAFDPVGVTSRIVNGYVLPIIALTNMSLTDPENARIYSQIPEYQKDNNIVFVYGGQIFSIPVPQEISNFTRPVQSAVESAYSANRHSFTELFTNEVVSAFPLDFSGFTNIDRNPLTSDDLWTAHIAPGLARLSSEMLSPVAKSAVMAVTHVDPYTMKNVDTSYVQTDPDTGEQIIMDNSAGNVAKWIGSLFGGNTSAGMAQAMLNTLLGRGNRTILDGIGGLAASVLDGNDETNLFTAATDFLQAEGELLIKPLTVERYGEYSNQMWRQAVSQLYNEKEAMVRDEKYQADLRIIVSSTASEKAKNEAKSRIKTKQTAYQEHVLAVVNNLKDQLGGTLDRNKFASVISLMIIGDSTNQNPDDAYQSYLTSQEYQSNKAAAVETMARMGFRSVDDQSIFGYYKQENDGSTHIVYNSPLAVLDYDLNSSAQSKQHLANVRTIVNNAGLWDAHESVKDQITKIYNKKKLSNSDYAKIDAIRINWDAQVASALADYVSAYTAEAAINNTDVRNYLEPLIEVPSSWEKNNQGRSVTLGSRGVKKDAYYDSWIKSMFNVNDPYKGQY